MYTYMEDFIWEMVAMGCSKYSVPQGMHGQRSSQGSAYISYGLILLAWDERTKKQSFFDIYGPK